jgi:hypothetical protein
MCELLWLSLNVIFNDFKARLLRFHESRYQFRVHYTINSNFRKLGNDYTQLNSEVKSQWVYKCFWSCFHLSFHIWFLYLFVCLIFFMSIFCFIIDLKFWIIDAFNVLYKYIQVMYSLWFFTRKDRMTHNQGGNENLNS